MTAREDDAPRHGPLYRYVLLAVGWLAIAAGVVGIFLPVLPTVPFLLLAAACFARSSPRFYRWLLEHPTLGPLVAGYLDGRGITRRTKIMALTMLWVSIGLSCFLWVSLTWLRVLMIACALLASACILRQPTRTG